MKFKIGLIANISITQTKVKSKSNPRNISSLMSRRNLYRRFSKSSYHMAWVYSGPYQRYMLLTTLAKKSIINV